MTNSIVIVLESFFHIHLTHHHKLFHLSSRSLWWTKFNYFQKIFSLLSLSLRFYVTRFWQCTPCETLQGFYMVFHLIILNVRTLSCTLERVNRYELHFVKNKISKYNINILFKICETNQNVFQILTDFCITHFANDVRNDKMKWYDHKLYLLGKSHPTMSSHPCVWLNKLFVHYIIPLCLLATMEDESSGVIVYKNWTLIIFRSEKWLWHACEEQRGWK